ncbi:MAG TPA: VOC family protein [Symbiobacteriaceae bacterium]|nr:VOC family protein [Symbiobacteriaceae bacterium]
MATGIFERVDTFIVRVSDYKKAQAWYIEKLGLETSFVDDEQKLAVMKVSPTSITLWQLKAGETRATGVSSFPIFHTKDLVATRQLLLDRGVEAEEVEGTPSAGWFSFWDLDGNKMEVCHFD